MKGTSASLLTIFGASGDLSQRMLLPSLYSLESEGLLPAGLRILGTARSELDGEGFRAMVAQAISLHVPGSERNEATLRSLLERVDYQPVSLDDPASLERLGEKIEASRDGDVVYHLSTASRWYAPICDTLGAQRLGGAGTRVLLEKPLGHDLASAIAINDGVARVFDEDRVFRVDHYLGKEGVQNLLALRFGNALFEPLWNARHIEQVQITVAETFGVEGRGDYYDHSGAMRDMLQNHLLQLLCLVAIEPPSQFDPSAVRNEKIKVLRSLRAIGRDEVASETVAGQYTAGAIGGVAVPGYLDELGRSVPHSIFDHGKAPLQPNALVIRLQPDERIELRLMSKTPGLDRSGLQLSQVALNLDMQEEFALHRRRLAYERLYLDAIEGNGTLFVRRDETEAAWQWVDAIHDGWRHAGMVPKPYPAGTCGPGSAVTLTDRHGHGWLE